MGVIQREIIIMFVMMAVGFICGKTGLIDSEGNRRLSNLSLLLVNPMLIFMSYQTDFSADIAKNLAYTLLAAVISYAVQIIAATLIIRKKRGEYAIERISLIFSNCAYIGIPLVQSVFGTEGVIYVTVYITVFNLLIWTLGVSLMTGKMTLRGTLKSLCTPAVISVFAGLVCFFCSIRLPGMLAEPLQSVGGMNTPLAMLIAGATLSGVDLLKCLRKPVLYLLSAARLLLIPAVCVLCLVPLRFIGAGDTQLAIVVIASACPCAAITIMFAHRYGRDSGYASELFALSTLFSVVTIPLIMKFLSLFGVAV